MARLLVVNLGLQTSETELAKKLLSHCWTPGEGRAMERPRVWTKMLQVTQEGRVRRTRTGMALIEVLIALAIAELGIGANWSTVAVNGTSAPPADL
jgi:hypothetical protein